MTVGTGGASRRTFLRRSVSAAVGLALGESVASAQTPPTAKLNMAFIGVGGRGASNLKGLGTTNNVVALCDVDDRAARGACQQFPAAKQYRDYRVLLEEQGSSLDAVAISTPDHTHAVAAMEAIRRGIHVYCEKPLAHSIHEVRALARAAREKGVVTQLGNQGHSTPSIRGFVESLRSGAIGEVHTIHACCNSSYSRIRELPLMSEEHPIPDGLDWNLWLGPATFRAYHPAYLPGKWRGWKAFGDGVIGDWLCHVVDPSFWALELGAPSSVEAVSVGDYDPSQHSETFPAGCTIRYDFPAAGSRGPVTLFWYSGLDAEKMPRPDGLEENRPLPRIGAVVLGKKGAMVHGSHGAGEWRTILPGGKKAEPPPPPTLPRVGDHYRDFEAAIRDRRKAGSDFAQYGGPLTEIALLGIIAMGLPGRKLSWDGAAGRFVDCEEANRELTPSFRKGWSL